MSIIYFLCPLDLLHHFSDAVMESKRVFKMCVCPMVHVCEKTKGLYNLYIPVFKIDFRVVEVFIQGLKVVIRKKAQGSSHITESV